MDDTARRYRDHYNEAAEHLFQGREDVALDICWELRLKPDLGIFRRAAVNLLIATLVDNEKLKYAEECLDLIDILRQEKKSVGARTERMKEVARKYIEDLEKAEAQKCDAAKSGAGKVADSTNDPGEGSSKGKPEPESAAVVVMPWTPISTGGGDDNEVKKTPDDTFQIEGYLRDPALHKPREK